MRPDIPQRSSNRPLARFFHMPFQGPPPYAEYNDVTGPRGEKFSDLRNNRHVAKRGGWTRVLLIALVVLLIIVGLAVGLGVGLTRSKRSSRYSTTVADRLIDTNSIGTVPLPPHPHLKRQLHLFQQDRTALTPICLPSQQHVLRIRTRGDAIRTPHTAKVVQEQTPRSIGSSHLQRKMAQTIQYPRPTIPLPSILTMQRSA